jgi:hypothetical protein
MKVETTAIVCPLSSGIARDELVRSLFDQGVPLLGSDINCVLLVLIPEMMTPLRYISGEIESRSNR